MNTAETLRALFAYCKAENWAGHDPYDALNSPLLDPDRGWAPKLVRLVATQFMKRSPLDVRPLMRTPKTQNAKALALNLETVHWLQQSRLVLDRPMLLRRHLRGPHQDVGQLNDQ